MKRDMPLFVYPYGSILKPDLIKFETFCNLCSLELTKQARETTGSKDRISLKSTPGSCCRIKSFPVELPYRYFQVSRE